MIWWRKARKNQRKNDDRRINFTLDAEKGGLCLIIVGIFVLLILFVYQHYEDRFDRLEQMIEELKAERQKGEMEIEADDIDG